MEIQFDGKRALVTGAGKGLGRCIAKALSAGGAHTIALSRTAADLVSLKTEDSRIQTVVCDVADWDETRQIVRGLGPIDLLVNSAGVSLWENALTMSPDNFDRMININVKAILNISQIVAKGMIERKSGGSIVHMSSILSTLADPGGVSYCASKAAVDQMMRVMTLEWGPHQIRVNSVCPSLVPTTPMGRKVLETVPGIEELIMQRVPQKKFLTEENISNAVLYLLSDKADMITGTALLVDGGERIA